MPQTPDDFSPKPKNDFRWIGSNAALVLLCAGLIAVQWWSVTARQTERIGKENRFLTTEWFLLQQLRKQTDAELAAKNLEIERLRRLYEDLKAQNNSPATLAEVEAQLRVAEMARGTMLVDGAKSGLRLTPPSSRPGEASLVEPSTESVLKQRLHTLEEQVNSTLARAEAAETALAGLRRQLAAGEAAPEDRALLAQALGQLEHAKQETITAPPTLAELRTKALTRAILNSPDVKRQYPRLLEEFDQYLDSFGNREYQRGRTAGLADSTEMVRALAP